MKNILFIELSSNKYFLQVGEQRGKTELKMVSGNMAHYNSTVYSNTKLGQGLRNQFKHLSLRKMGNGGRKKTAR